jgi:hypothetical protein
MARSILDFAQQNTERGMQTTKARTLQGRDERHGEKTDESKKLA